MPKAIDWDALRQVFEPETPSQADTDMEVYNGKKMPRWLARDLMQERAAVMEFDGGLKRHEAQRLTRLGLIVRILPNCPIRINTQQKDG